MATIRSNRPTERSGINAVRALFDAHGHLVQEIDGGADHGEDMHIILARERKRTGHVIAVQVKSGKKYRRKHGYAIPVGDHFEDWRNYRIPVVGIVYDAETERLFWVNLTECLGACDQAPRAVPVPVENELSPRTVDAITVRLEAFIDTWAGPESTPQPLPEPASRARGGTPVRRRRPPTPLWCVPTGSRQILQPRICEGTLAVRDGHLLRIFDAASGEERRPHRLAYRGEPALGDGAAYIAAAAGRLRALDLVTGRIRWERELRVQDTFATVIASTLYAPGPTGDLHAIETSDGALRWSAPSPGNLLAAPVPMGDSVLVIGDAESPADDSPASLPESNRVVAISTTSGAEKWSHTAKGMLSARFAFSDSAVHVVEHLSTHCERLTALNRSDGTQRWTYDLDETIAGHPVVTGNVLYLAGSSGSIHAVDTRTGAPLWSTTTRLATTLAPLIDGSTVIVAATVGTLTALDAMSGEERWRRRASGGFVAQPFLAGDHLYAAHRAGRMLMCDIGNGQLRCSYELMWDPSRQGEPVFADGILYVTSGRGDIHALALV